MPIDLSSLSLWELIKLKTSIDWYIFKRLWWVATALAVIFLTGWFLSKRGKRAE